MKRTWMILALLVAAFSLFGCKPAETPAQEAATAEPAAITQAQQAESQPVTEAAPASGGEYAGVTFTGSDLNGRKITETLLRDNKVTVVNFWATWCPPCVGEIPAFSEVAKAYAGKDCAFLGVQLDEDIEAAKEMWEKNAVSYPSILPDGDLAGIAARLSAIPVTMLFDGEGRQIGDMHVGALEKDMLTELIETALKAE